MKLKRSAAILLLATLVCTGGCGTIESRLSRIVAIVTPAEQKRQLTTGLEYLEAGKEQEAADMFERVIVAPPLDGVTDEALFRLALLHLGDEGGKGVTRAQALLERLKNEFPPSIWTHQAAPLASYMTGVKNLRGKDKELKALRELNLSLSRDNKELRQSIERLKSLDLELDQKIRR